jgi:hypothetical protein
MVAENSQYWPEVTRAREFIERGAIGEIVTGELMAGPEMAVGELRAVQAMYRSAETRRWERVWD